MRSTPYESAAAPTSHSATDPAEFNVICRTKPDLPNQTDSNAALLLYLTHQLGSVHEWSGVWNGPQQRPWRDDCSLAHEFRVADADRFESCISRKLFGG